MISKILLFFILVQCYKNDLKPPVFGFEKDVPKETKHITDIIVSGDLRGEILASATSQYVEHNPHFSSIPLI